MNIKFYENLNEINRLGFNEIKKSQKSVTLNCGYKQMAEIPSDNGALRTYFMGGMSFKGSVEEKILK